MLYALQEYAYYAGLALGRDGTAYLGVTSGIVALRDG